MTFKDVKCEDWETAYDLIYKILRNEFERHSELLASDKISAYEKQYLTSVLSGEANENDVACAFLNLSRLLHLHYGVAPMIIIDEYDTPIQEGFLNGYYDDAVEFIRSFFSAALKDNPHARQIVMTGILRIAKESIFSGLNNIRVFSVLDKKFSEFFGFTTSEVQQMAAYYEQMDKLPELKAWYDGYKFGDTEIFNPWSVINYFSNNCQAMPYWVQTSANTIIQEILKTYNDDTYRNLHALLGNTEVQSIVRTNIIYPKLKEPQTNILGFLLMTGYLKSTSTELDARGDYICRLSIPNKEIKTIYYNEILSLLTEDIGENTVMNLANALYDKDVGVELSKLAQTALKQIEEKKYDTELCAQGIDDIIKYFLNNGE